MSYLEVGNHMCSSVLELIVKIVNNFDRINELIGISEVEEAESISYKKLVKHKKNLAERIDILADKNFIHSSEEETYFLEQVSNFRELILEMSVENNLSDYNKQDIIALTNTVLNKVDFKEINVQNLFNLLTVVEVDKPSFRPEIFTKAIKVLDEIKSSRKGKVKVLVITPEDRIRKI